MKQSLPTLHDIINNLDIYGIQTPREERDMTISQFKLLLTVYLESQASDNCAADEWHRILVTNTIEEYVDTLSNLKLMMLAAGVSTTIIPSPEDMNKALKSL